MSEVHGVRVELALSPYDVPQGVRGYKEKNSNYFVIEFKYLTDERTRTVPHQNRGILVELGINSGRIYKIKLDFKALNCDTVELRLKRLFEEELSPRAGRLADTYRLNEDIILNNRERLFSEANQ